MPWNSRSANVSANQQVKQLYLCKGNLGEYEERATLILFTGLPPKFSSKLLHFPSTNPRFLLLSNDVHCNGTELKYIPAKHHLRLDTTLLGRLLGTPVLTSLTWIQPYIGKMKGMSQGKQTNQPNRKRNNRFSCTGLKQRLNNGTKASFLVSWIPAPGQKALCII